MSPLLISPRAAADLEEIADYIALDSHLAAVRLVTRFERVAHLLSEHTGIGTKREDIASDFQGFAIGTYLICTG